jgi:hypothetical protein
MFEAFGPINITQLTELIFFRNGCTLLLSLSLSLSLFVCVCVCVCVTSLIFTCSLN